MASWLEKQRLHRPRAVVVQQNEMSNLATGSMAALMSMTTLRKKKKGKHSSTVAQSSTFSPLLRDGPSTSLNTVTFPPERGRGVPTLTPAPRFGVSPPAQNENLSKADLTTTSRSDAEVTPKTPMPPAALYSIIAAGGVFFILAIIFACICFRRRKNQDRQTADWYGIQEKRLSGTTFGGPGKGPVTRKMQLSDDDSYLDDEKYSEPDAIANVPTHILFKFPKLGKESKGTGQQEKPMEISKPFGMNLHVTNPDFVPTRPPRPSAHIDLGHPGNLTPMNALKEDDNIIDDDEEDDEEEVYERNILALTTSMAFDTPRDRQSRAFDPSLPLPDSADIGTSMKDGRDTIVGFAESYGAVNSPLPQEEIAPVRPLHIRNPSTATTRSKRPQFFPDVKAKFPPSDGSKVSATPPTLSNVHLDLPTSGTTTSMRELEDVLGSFGRSGTPPERGNPIEEAYEPNQVSSDGATFIMESGKTSSATSKIPAYKLNKPMGVECGLSVVRNTLSIQSTAGEVFDTSPTYSTFPASATSPNLSNMSHGESNEVLVESASTLSGKRVSFAIDKERMLADTGRVHSLAELIRSKSLKRFNSNSDLKQANLRGAFEEMDNTTIADSTDSFKATTGLQSFSSRVRSSSFHGLSPALHSGWRADRQRTSTAYGGQMPPTPLLATPLLRKDKRKTTDSEARFALGSHMLSVLDSPNGADQVSPSLPYLRSPDLRVQPPSPSQASENTTFSALDRERDDQGRLAQQGFTPLAQMALSSGNSGHSHYYRSPIDSIVGVFEFDDPHHSAVINSISVR